MRVEKRTTLGCVSSTALRSASSSLTDFRWLTADHGPPTSSSIRSASSFSSLYVGVPPASSFAVMAASSRTSAASAASSLSSSAGCTCSARMSAYRGKSDGCASSGLLFSVGSAMQEAETAATVEPTIAAPVGVSRGRAATLRAWRAPGVARAVSRRSMCRVGRSRFRRCALVGLVITPTRPQGVPATRVGESPRTRPRRNHFPRPAQAGATS